MEIFMKDGSVISDEQAVANAHTSGERAFKREDYIKKFRTLLEGLVSENEQERFLKLVQRLPELSESEVCQINVVLDETQIETGFVNKEGIF